MTTFKSMPNSSANQQFLQNVQSYAKTNNVNQVSLVKQLEGRLLIAFQNAYNQKGVTFQSVKMDQKNGDLIVNVNENGTLQSYINPRTGLPSRGKWLPFGGWSQDDSKKNSKGEPIDENGLTKGEYDKNEESLADFGWCKIITGKSWSEWWADDEGEKDWEDLSYLEKIDFLNNDLLNP